MKKTRKCIVCGSENLTPVFSPETTALFRQEPGYRENIPGYALCDPSKNRNACGLLQSESHFPAPLSVPSSRYCTNRMHLRSIASQALESVSGRDCSALDIGCSDGVLLSFYPCWVECYGVDPCRHADSIGNWARIAKTEFPSYEFYCRFGHKKFDIITALSVIEFIEDPLLFIHSVKKSLKKNGVFILETLYAPLVLMQNGIQPFQSGICSLYTLSILDYLVRSAGMKIFRGMLTSKDGGSIRLFITHQDSTSPEFSLHCDRLAELWDEESALALRSISPYQSFERRLEDIRHDFINILHRASLSGKKVHFLGACRKTRALLEWAEPASSLIGAVIDIDGHNETFRDKSGLRVLSGMDFSCMDFSGSGPDIIIVPTMYKYETLECWQEVIMQGLDVCFLYPSPHLVNRENFPAEYAQVIAGSYDSSAMDNLRSILAPLGGPRLVSRNTCFPANMHK